MSIIELIAAVSGVTSIFLAVKMKKSNYILSGICGVLMIYLLVSTGTYAMSIVRGVMVGLCIKGYIDWNANDKNECYIQKPIRYYAILYIPLAITFFILFSFARYDSLLHLLIDSSASSIAVMALYLQTKKYLYAWYFWIVSDILGFILMLYLEYYLLAAQFAIFMVICVKGYFEWKQKLVIPEPIMKEL